MLLKLANCSTTGNDPMRCRCLAATAIHIDIYHYPTTTHTHTVGVFSSSWSHSNPAGQYTTHYCLLHHASHPRPAPASTLPPSPTSSLLVHVYTHPEF